MNLKKKLENAFFEGNLSEICDAGFKPADVYNGTAVAEDEAEENSDK